MPSYSALLYLEGRPFKSWFNLTQRALSQSTALHYFAAQSKGSFFIIKSKSNLKDFLDKRRSNRKIINRHQICLCFPVRNCLAC